MLRRGDRSSGDGRFLKIRLALLWLGALVWLTGVVLERSILTGAAMGILFAALLLGLIARRSGSGPQDEPERQEGRHL